MAAVFDASGDALVTTSPPITDRSTQTYTIMAWGFSADYSSNQAFFAISNDSVADDMMFAGSDTLQTNVDNTETVFGTIGGLVDGTWNHVAMARSSQTSLKGYLNGTLDHTNTRSATSTSQTRIDFARWASSNQNPFNGRLCCIKIWSTELSASEIRAEMFTVYPQRFANLHAWYPVLPGERTRDYGPSGLTFTEAGTLADETGPPQVAWRRYPNRGNLYVVAAGGGGSVVKDMIGGGYIPFAR